MLCRVALAYNVARHGTSGVRRVRNVCDGTAGAATPRVAVATGRRIN